MLDVGPFVQPSKISGMKRRDRWASSSSDEEERAGSKSRSSRKIGRREKSSLIAKPDADPTAKKTPQENGSKPDTFQNSYNPLLQGCRSVYDTYEQLERISEGTYGIVWKARCLSSNRILALKQMKFPNADGRTESSSMQHGVWKDGFPLMALREINALLALRGHDNIVSLHEIVVGQKQFMNPPPQIYMVMEYYHCDLKTAIYKYTTEVIAGPLLQSELKGILQQIFMGIRFVHRKGYLHRDLKPSNILVQCSRGASNQKCRIAIADFGLARSFHHGSNMTLPVVTLWYRAPELLFGQTRYTSAIDMWSMGCIMGELVRSTGMIPPSVSMNDDDVDDFEHSGALLKGHGELDQIDAIFQLVGVPNATTWPLFDTLPNAKLLRWKAIPDHDILLPKLFSPVFGSTSGQQTFLDGNGYFLLRELLALDPLQRIDADHALNHPYFTEGIVPQIPNFTF